MTTLYAIAQANGCLVAGTGNKVEDFGIGFFTKYGDGGVDLSPIADLSKTEVWQLRPDLERRLQDRSRAKALRAALCDLPYRHKQAMVLLYL